MVAARYKKDDLLNCWTSSWDNSGYHADFYEGHGTVGTGQGRGMVKCELTAWHGRGTVWVRHAVCESALRLQVDEAPRISRQTTHDGGKMVSRTQSPPLPPGDVPGTHLC